MARRKMPVGEYEDLCAGLIELFVGYDHGRKVLRCKQCSNWSVIIRDDNDAVAEFKEHLRNCCSKGRIQDTRVRDASIGRNQGQLGLLESDDVPIAPQGGNSRRAGSSLSDNGNVEIRHYPPQDITCDPNSNFKWNSGEETKNAAEKSNLKLSGSDSGSGEYANNSGSTNEESSIVEASSNLEADVVPPEDAEKKPRPTAAISEPTAAAGATSGTTRASAAENAVGLAERLTLEERRETFNDRLSESAHQLAREGFYQPYPDLQEIRCHICKGALYEYEQKTLPSYKVCQEAHANNCTYRQSDNYRRQ